MRDNLREGRAGATRTASKMDAISDEHHGTWTAVPLRLGQSDAALPRSHAANFGRGRPPAGYHGAGNAVVVRRADPLSPRRWISAANHQEAASALDYRRTAVVPARRHQHRLAQRAQ